MQQQHSGAGDLESTVHVILLPLLLTCCNIMQIVIPTMQITTVHAGVLQA